MTACFTLPRSYLQATANVHPLMEDANDVDVAVLGQTVDEEVLADQELE